MIENWEIVKKEATIGLRKETIYKSFIQERLYKIINVQEDRIVIERISGGKPANFTKGEVLAAIKELKLNKRIRKGELIHSVIREAMLVHLHPSVHWDSTTHEVYWSENIPVPISQTVKFINQASDDDLEKISVLIKKRKNQSKFRKAILALYNNKCAISAMGPTTVLDAAHIIGHSATGINTNENGILLRSDLHNLFDDNLLLIHPKKLTVHLHPSLRVSYYSKYSDKKIIDRIDGSNPSQKYLQKKWDSATWTKLLV